MESVKKFEMVPASMLLDKNVISAINFHCGDDDGDEGQFGKYSDGLLWVGTVTDDDGKKIHGLHLATAEYPEEGSTTLVEFDAPATDQAEVERLTAERNALQLLLNDLEEQNHSLEQRRYAEQQACQAAERRVKELEAAMGQVQSLCMSFPEKAIGMKAHYVRQMLDIATRALNPTAEAVSHE